MKVTTYLVTVLMCVLLLSGCTIDNGVTTSRIMLDDENLLVTKGVVTYKNNEHSLLYVEGVDAFESMGEVVGKLTNKTIVCVGASTESKKVEDLDFNIEDLAIGESVDLYIDDTSEVVDSNILIFDISKIVIKEGVLD